MFHEHSDRHVRPATTEQFGDAQDNDWPCCWSSSPGQRITTMGCECYHFDRIRNSFLSRSSPVQTMACSCGGRLHWRREALPARVPCLALGSEFYYLVNHCHWQRWSMTCR